MAKSIIATTISNLLGFQNLRFIIACHGKLCNDVVEKFLSLDALIVQSYGLCETTGFHMVGKIGSFDHGKVPFQDCRTKVFGPDRISGMYN